MNSAVRRCQLLLLWFSGTVIDVGQALRLVPLMGDDSGVLIAEVNGTEGGVCPDGFTLREATVACRQLGLGWGRYLRPMELNSTMIPSRRHVIKVSNCYGNESDITYCTVHGDAFGVPCQETYAMGVTCVEKLPDIEANVYLVESSSYVMRLPLYTLACAMEEHCLAPSAAIELRDGDPATLYHSERVLLRFTSVIKNVGTAAFLPLLQKHQWRFHSCHMHYHSMPDFARYSILDRRYRKVAVGHKSSFCLEDSECDSGTKEHFRCSHVSYNYGDQGISPGCVDSYFHDYDCQWVDITDLRYGKYIFEMVINPRYLVAESNYANNGIQCDFHYTEYTGVLRRCFVKHPLQLRV